MLQELQSILGRIHPNAVVDIAITALLIYWLFSLIRGTRAVRLVIGVLLLFLVYIAAQAFDLVLLTQILQTGAYVGLFALVVVFQPELRRALDRIGRLGSLAWLTTGEQSAAAHVAGEVARAATRLSHEGHGALIVIERETGLQEIAENGVMLHADLSSDLLVTIFAPRTPLHDGAVIIRGDGILAAGSLLPSAETTLHAERFGTRHKAALGITEQTDALVVVVSEESGQISLVQRARIVRNLDEAKLARALTLHLHPQRGAGGLLPVELERPRSIRPGIVRDLARRARIGRLHRESAASRPPEGNRPADDSAKDRAELRTPRVDEDAGARPRHAG